MAFRMALRPLVLGLGLGNSLLAVGLVTEVWGLGCHIGALIIRIGFGGIYFPILIFRNPPNSIGS